MSSHLINIAALIIGCVIILAGVTATVIGIIYRKQVNPNTFNLPVAMGVAFILGGIFTVSLSFTPEPDAQYYIGEMQTDLSYASTTQEDNQLFMGGFRHELWRMYVDGLVDSTTYTNWMSRSDSAYYAKNTETYKKYSQQMKNDLPQLLALAH